MEQNSNSTMAGDIAGRIAHRSLARRSTDYASEVRRLLDAATEVIQHRGTRSRPRVADIVAAAELSNDAFYRHFRSKDALIAALLEDGTERLYGYVAHQMNKESTAQRKVRRWVRTTLSQASGDVAATTRAILWNADSLAEQTKSASSTASAALAQLLHGPFTELGSTEPEFTASLAAHATVGKLADYLWQERQPTRRDSEHITSFCLHAAEY